MPYAFYINDREVTATVGEMVHELGLSTEATLVITCQPLAVFRVRPVTRCGETLPGQPGEQYSLARIGIQAKVCCRPDQRVWKPGAQPV